MCSRRSSAVRRIAVLPRLDGKPVILRVHVKDIGGIWSLNNFEMCPAVLLDLPGGKHARGIRTMEYDPSPKGTLIVTGNPVSRTRCRSRSASGTATRQAA